MKKVWKKPKLVGIYRAQPYEAVLVACKNFDAAGDPGSNKLNCQTDAVELGCDCKCYDCNTS